LYGYPIACRQGQYYLFVVTDDANQVVEYNPPADAEANNVSAAVPITTQLQVV
jgi:hypothetical protein